MPPVDSTVEIRVETERYSSLEGGSGDQIKEIVNIVFNKSTQETRRTQLSRLILHKKEMSRKE